jgi:hypothetical protein
MPPLWSKWSHPTTLLISQSSEMHQRQQQRLFLPIRMANPRQTIQGIYEEVVEA